jgi:hypothetical protein
MTTLKLETILDSELNNQPATKADLRHLGMHFESKFAMVDARFEQIDARFTEVDARFTEVDACFARVDMRLVDLDTKISNLGTQIRLDLDEFQLKMETSMNRNFRQSAFTLIGFAFTAMAIMVAIPRFG